MRVHALKHATVLLVLSSLVIICILSFQADAAPRKLSPVEEFVRQHAANGEWAIFLSSDEVKALTPSAKFRADLLTGKYKFYKHDQDRTLSARFLEDLLTGLYKVHRKGIWLKNAIIAEPLNMELAQIKHAVGFINCHFQENLSFRDAVFENHFNVHGSHFRKKADFHRLKAKINFFCRKATFHGPVDFGGANIGGHFIASEAQFLNEQEKVNFNALKVDNSIFFDDAIFKGPVDFAGSNISKQFVAKGAQFTYDKEIANFNSVRVGQSILLDNAIFKGPVDFRCAVIIAGFEAKGIQFLNKHEKADFNALKVGQSAHFDHAIFNGPVVFNGADIEKQLIANEAQFLNDKEKADFIALSVKQDASFKKVIFKGPVAFAGASIGRLFMANEAQFTNEKETVNFNSMKVGMDSCLDKATFEGPMDFSGTNIGRQFRANEARFLNEQEKADFSSIKVGQSVIFNHAIFKGPVAFRGADIVGNFEANMAQFSNENEKADFNALKVEQNAFFANAIFKGPVAFVAADIGGQFNANGAQFLNESAGVDFNGMHVGQSAFFRPVTFKGNVNISYGVYQNLYIAGAAAENSERNLNRIYESPRISLQGSSILRELVLKNFYLNSLEAPYLEVRGLAIFESLSIPVSANFQNSTIDTLWFKDINWPEGEKNLKLDGLTYKSLCIDESGNFPRLLALIDRSSYNSQNYIQLEDYCKRNGHQDWADTVYIAKKDRELKQVSWYNLGGWFEWLFWGMLTGYGRHPFRAFYAGLGIIVIGTVLFFDPRYLTKSRRDPWKLFFLPKFKDYFTRGYAYSFWSRLYNLFKLALLRFLLSLDQFVPGINLKIVQDWQPPQLSFWTWIWLKFQAICGWILIPVGLAAIFSQLK